MAVDSGSSGEYQREKLGELVFGIEMLLFNIC